MPDGPGDGAPSEVLRFEVLGPLRVLRAGSELDLGYPQARALLGVLLVWPGRPVRMSTIVDVLWPGRPPANATNAVRRHVGALRRLLEPGLPPRAPGRRLLGRTGGYLLEATADEADLPRFRASSRRGMRAAATARPEQAVRHFAGALRLWRGPVAADLPGPVRTHPHFAAVDQEILRTARMAADAALLCGRADQVLPSVRRAAALNPLDEPLLARLILSLAACGLQAEALATYEDTRRHLAEQLGVAPGAELAAAHARVLRRQIRPTKHRLPTGPPAPARPGIRPAQLPPDLPVFTGRQRELATLDTLLGGEGVGAPREFGTDGESARAAPQTWADGESAWATPQTWADGEPARATPGALRGADTAPDALRGWIGGEPVQAESVAPTGADSGPAVPDTRTDEKPVRHAPDAVVGRETAPDALRPWIGGEPLPAVPAARTDGEIPRVAPAPSTAGHPASAVLISGPAGVGKTALAVHWAHRVADRFPDGQLHLELGGSAPDQAALEPAEALRRLLGALGVPARNMPASLAGLTARYRGALAERRLLVLLDDAACLRQILPLLPEEPGCLAVVTSRGGSIAPGAVSATAGATGVSGPTGPATRTGETGMTGATGSAAFAGPATATGPSPLTAPATATGPSPLTAAAGATRPATPAVVIAPAMPVEPAGQAGTAVGDPDGPAGRLALSEPWERAATGLRTLRLGLPSEADARDLLTRRIGAARSAAEPEAVTEIVRRCGRLPSALALVAARVASRRDFPLTALAADLAEDAGP
ncbi:BTAD domain-containing putative transcriptional regulator [Streptomyces sp. NPDC017673]|uniref:BTAD domain-containing putative transcriptional regulator n=1 Tax=unclassified Streptomyces TaxID=2593676 RepID=UPI0037A65CA3